MDVEKYNCYFIPLITGYLLLLSYQPQLFKFFGNDYYQLLLLVSILYIYFKCPSIGWLLGILFLLTYRSYHETQFIKEAFTQKFSLPPKKKITDIQYEINKELTKDEESVIQSINKKYSDSIEFLLEDNSNKFDDYSCVAHGDGIGLPSPVKEYDLSKTINFNF
jgi:uncharacterized membrane protein